MKHAGEATTSKHYAPSAATTPLGSVQMYKVSPDIKNIGVRNAAASKHTQIGIPNDTSRQPVKTKGKSGCTWNTKKHTRLTDIGDPWLRYFIF